MEQGLLQCYTAVQCIFWLPISNKRKKLRAYAYMVLPLASYPEYQKCRVVIPWQSKPSDLESTRVSLKRDFTWVCFQQKDAQTDGPTDSRQNDGRTEPLIQLGKDEVGDFNNPCCEVNDFSDFKAVIKSGWYWNGDPIFFLFFYQKILKPSCFW